MCMAICLISRYMRQIKLTLLPIPISTIAIYLCCNLNLLLLTFASKVTKEKNNESLFLYSFNYRSFLSINFPSYPGAFVVRQYDCLIVLRRFCYCIISCRKKGTNTVAEHMSVCNWRGLHLSLAALMIHREVQGLKHTPQNTIC